MLLHILLLDCDACVKVQVQSKAGNGCTKNYVFDTAKGHQEATNGRFCKSFVGYGSGCRSA